ncbi:MAG: 2-hydroxychromene-2-carboxylate isomerase [Ottowia sp.]|uniref:2-hydroxychromene-2-carboxylate isomerase n=1 Tax=Ottowia beijingensis TaxID=1207057 RepID=UPI001B525894|nr:2-hydroxychromene-2-carboxylate isomerase [Ottowia sp.]MBP9954276.1 2-hydroxychromene-2-carboxylate isomerase [Ottowia sp.]
MPPQVDFYFDVGSPAAYLAFTQIEAIAREAGASVNHKPMLLGGVFQATGNASPATVPAKGAYTFTDFDRFARRYGVPLKRNPHFPINTLALMRAVTGMQMREPARFLDFTRTVFESIWLHALNMNDPAVVAQVLQQAGYAPDAVLALSADPQVKAQLKAVTDEAVARGVFGAPTMFVGEQMFWGQDRLDWVREALAAP